MQIVKGWVDASGQSHEKVFDVAGDAQNGAGVDTSTCTPTGTGFDSLCAVWSDPEFDASERAFYYARALENPTCRWSTYLCNQASLDCNDPATIPSGYGECCNPAVAKTIQERAWSSPIWYHPEGIARVRAQVRFGTTPAHDVLDLGLNLGAIPGGYNPASSSLTVTVSDDDDVYAVTIPPGTLQPVRAGRYVYNDASGGLGGIRSLRLQQRGPGRVVFRLRTVPTALAAADRVDHFVQLSLRTGTTEITTTPLWHFNGRTLAAQN
jgi:hypothetical protein